MRYNDMGEELPDPTPLALPVDFVRPPTIQELYDRLVRDPAARQALASLELETEEQSEDFDIEDEIPDPVPAAAKAFGLDEDIVVAADEIRAGLRAKPDIADLYRKAKNAIDSDIKRADKKKRPASPDGPPAAKGEDGEVDPKPNPEDLENDDR